MNLSCRASEASKVYVGRGKSKADSVSLVLSVFLYLIVVASGSLRRECSKLRGMNLLEGTFTGGTVRGGLWPPVLFLLNIPPNFPRLLFQTACDPAGCCKPFFCKSFSTGRISLVNRPTDKDRHHRMAGVFSPLYFRLTSCKARDRSVGAHEGNVAAVCIKCRGLSW